MESAYLALNRTEHIGAIAVDRYLDTCRAVLYY